jgi:hypothetical protein
MKKGNKTSKIGERRSKMPTSRKGLTLGYHSPDRPHCLKISRQDPTGHTKYFQPKKRDKEKMGLLDDMCGIYLEKVETLSFDFLGHRGAV